MAACRAVPCRVMSACYGRVPLRAVSSKSQPRVMPCHVTHFLPLVRAVSWRVMTFKWRVMACRVMACHVPLRAVACRVISLSFDEAACSYESVPCEVACHGVSYEAACHGVSY